MTLKQWLREYRQSVKEDFDASWKYYGAILLVVALAAILATSTQAYAAPTCGTYEDITERLTEKYRERPVGRGKTIQGAMIEIYISFNGSFSIVKTVNDKVSCLILAGTQWRKIDENIEGMAINPLLERLF